jgi:hypothetical protein
MSTRGLVGKLDALAVIGCCALLGAACHSGPGKPVLPPACDGVYGAQDGREGAGKSPRWTQARKLLADRHAGGALPCRGLQDRQRRHAWIRRALDELERRAAVRARRVSSAQRESLLDLDPHDIKSIQVLKAEASTYGRAAPTA